MAPEKFKRKLTAILSADVKGYSRLMGEDEEGTIRTLNAYLAIIDGFIQQHRGRVVATGGDSVLAEFASVVDAVRCAVGIQEELKDRNRELAEDRRMEFRIGVNLGDVVEEGDNILGDGVNVAARVQGEAEAGGICISGTVYDQIKNKLAFSYEYVGEQAVKNIKEPVRVYRVRMDPEVVSAKVGQEKKSVGKGFSKTVMVAIAVIVIAVGAILYQFVLRPSSKIEVASKEKMAFPLPDKPSIAVLPFVNMSEDPKQEYLSDGITESIIMAISKNPSLFVIARNSTFTYKGKTVKVQQVAQELGVQYVLEGSIQRSGDKLRITAQLIDALKGSHIWAQRYDRELKDLFAMQDDITMEILHAMRLKLTEGMQVLRVKRPKKIEVALKAYEAQDYVLRFTPEANDMARKLAEEVIVMEPDWGEGYYILSEAHMMDVWLGMTNSPRESIDKAIALSEKAVSLDDSLAQALALIGYLYAMKGEHDKSVAYAEKATTTDPNGADANAWLGNCLNFASRPQDAIRHYAKAMRLNPRTPQWYYINLGVSYRMLGRYEESVAQYKKALALSPNSVTAYAALIVTYGFMGKVDEARAAAVELLRINPKFSADQYVKTLQGYKDREYVRQCGEALRKVGLK